MNAVRVAWVVFPGLPCGWEVWSAAAARRAGGGISMGRGQLLRVDINSKEQA